MDNTANSETTPSACEIFIGDGLLHNVGELISKAGLSKKAAVVTDSNVAPLYLDALKESLAQANISSTAFIVPAGEQSKSITQFAQVCEGFATANVDRGTHVIALGGGVVGDLAGFVAASYCRGLPIVHVPTTVMAQVDSSIGGKTGINLTVAKNLVGVFHVPTIVVTDPETLRTLSPREFNEGLAETIKHAVIGKPDLLNFLENYEPSNLAEFIRSNIQVKIGFIANDLQETTGQRALLNFGHTIGHAIEATQYGRYLHGEAISLGIRAALHLSGIYAGLPAEEEARVLSLCARYKLPLVLPPEISTDSILECIRHDKKHADGVLNFVLISKLGRAFSTASLLSGAIKEAIEHIRTEVA